MLKKFLAKLRDTIAPSRTPKAAARIARRQTCFPFRETARVVGARRTPRSEARSRPCGSAKAMAAGAVPRTNTAASPAILAIILMPARVNPVRAVMNPVMRPRPRASLVLPVKAAAVVAAACNPVPADAAAKVARLAASPRPSARAPTRLTITHAAVR